MSDFCRRDRRDSSLRFVPERSRVLLHRAIRDPCLRANGVPAAAGFERRDELVPITITELWPAQDLALCARSLQAGLGPLTDLFALQLGQRGESCEQDIADEFVLRRQVLFR